MRLAKSFFSSLVMARIWAARSFTESLFGEEFVLLFGQSFARCPLILQLKQAPCLMRLLLSSTDMLSTSMIHSIRVLHLCVSGSPSPVSLGASCRFVGLASQGHRQSEIRIILDRFLDPVFKSHGDGFSKEDRVGWRVF